MWFPPLGTVVSSSGRQEVFQWGDANCLEIVVFFLGIKYLYQAQKLYFKHMEEKI